ncbi:GntR family transcriptional regulator [Glutamicibacter ardleyensis]|uniref:GntR family transcriptional regulator n=1 Tax=Glutamicibacter ardleyensis TaxID=225894 RepID=UPI003FD3094D
MGTVATTAKLDTDQSSVTERVLSILRHEMVTGQLEPEQVINESETALRLGVSKTTVREALHGLLWEGFVIAFPRRGYVVRALGMNDIRDVMDLRMSIEPPIAGIAARRCSVELVKKLSQILARQDDKSAAYNEKLQATTDFHRAIASAAGNKRAERLLSTYFDETTRIYYLFSRAASYVGSPNDIRAHQEILEAISAQDAPRAQQAMIDHLQESNDALLRMLH